MPKNKGKGGKNRRRGKNENDNEKRELEFRDEGQEYALVKEMLGNGRVKTENFDKEPITRLANIRGKMKKKVWINRGDIVLLSLRDFQDYKADIILKYTADEVKDLKNYEELPKHVKVNETEAYGQDGLEDNMIEFDEDRDEEEEEEAAAKDIDVDEL